MNDEPIVRFFFAVGSMHHVRIALFYDRQNAELTSYYVLRGRDNSGFEENNLPTNPAAGCRRYI